jgi:hypothetical protein
MFKPLISEPFNADRAKTERATKRLYLSSSFILALVAPAGAGSVFPDLTTIWVTLTRGIVDFTSPYLTSKPVMIGLYLLGSAIIMKAMVTFGRRRFFQT